jgi:hypothetical protein
MRVRSSHSAGGTSGYTAGYEKVLGWTVQVDNCGMSYTIPLSLTIFRSGKVIQTIEPGPMIWGWRFLPGGQQVVVASGIHGAMWGRVGLFDVKSGKRLRGFRGRGKRKPHHPAPRNGQRTSRPTRTRAPAARSLRPGEGCCKLGAYKQPCHSKSGYSASKRKRSAPLHFISRALPLARK